MQVKIGPYPSEYNLFDKQEISVQIDDWDTWNMAETLGEIALPMLKQLKETKHGSPYVELEDVPEELRVTGTPRNETSQLDLFADEKYDSLAWNMTHARWDWVMNEIIFAFESIVGYNENWADKYFTGEWDRMQVPLDKDHKPLGPAQKWDEETDPEIESKVEYWEMVKGPNDTSEFDKVGYRREGERIANGFRLFGKYYQGLWD